jgi:O-acetyl-ADP-ribose deacetylase (regulator of RNase III)
MSVVRIIQGDLFDSGAQTLVNTVNTVGVMGKGIAAGFKRRFPEMYEEYRRRCDMNAFKLGEPYIYRPPSSPWIINFPTKGHWRSPSKLADIERGLAYLAEHVEDWGVESLAVPPLGCGNGELEWRVVGPVIYEHLDRLSVPVVMYAPFDTPLVQLEESFLTHQLALIQDAPEVPAEFKVTPAMVALVEVLFRLEQNPLAPRIGKTLFQKLAYFGTEADLPTELEFERGPYGPFAAGVKDIEKRLVNNSLIDERPVGDLLHVKVGPAFKRARGNFAEEFHGWQATIDRLVDLFSRMGTREAEIAATVHFAAKELNSEREIVTELEVCRFVDEWKPAKFTQEDVAAAIRNLALLGWLQVKASPSLPVPRAASGATL